MSHRKFHYPFWGRAAFFVAAILSGVLGLGALHDGKIIAFSRTTHRLETTYASDEPVMFWIGVCLDIALSLVCFSGAFAKKK